MSNKIYNGDEKISTPSTLGRIRVKLSHVKIDINDMYCMTYMYIIYDIYII